MFILAVVFSIIIGYLLKGRLKNLENIEVHGLYLALAGFLIEFIINMLIMRGVLSRGYVTLLLDLLMYLIIFLFIYLNRKNMYLLTMGIGFLLNAIPIFLNGGAMPVEMKAMRTAGLFTDVSREGLYNLINSNTKLWFLGDIIPINFIGRFVVSVGDIISAVGLMMFIIMGMKKQGNK